MTKAKITFSVEVEYEINPTFYPEGLSPEEMLKIDIKLAEDDPFVLLSGNDEWKVTGELI